MENKTFDTEKWIAESEKEPEENRRWSMTEEFQAVVKPGMSRPNVLRILGEPDSRRDRGGSLVETYYLGVPWGSIDTTWYDLTYKNDVLDSISHHQG